ncbi:MAG: aldo/keto reductase [Gemmatimonadales bacterium]
MSDFLHTTLGSTGMAVHRLGVSASYWPGRATLYRAFDEGVNFCFAFGLDWQMVRALRDAFRAGRDRFVLATGAYNLLVGHPNLRRTLEKRLRQFRTDHIDVFLFLGVTKPRHFSEHVRAELARFREEGTVRAIGLSTHHRRFAGALLRQGAIDVAMIRYNAAHRGAETEIFPETRHHGPGVVSYTATRWRYLLRRPRGWPKEARIPTPGECYRFVLSNPHVHVCLTAPSNLRQFDENLTAVRAGPLSQNDLTFMRAFGDAVHRSKRWFM